MCDGPGAQRFLGTAMHRQFSLNQSKLTVGRDRNCRAERMVQSYGRELPMRQTRVELPYGLGRECYYG
jgi:hypothetical protein